MSTPKKDAPTRDAPAFDFYPERWLVGVAGMSDAEQISYLRLLCHQWLLGDAGLPPDLPALKRLAGGKGVTPAVLAKLPPSADGKRRNKRLEVIRAEQRERIAKKSEQRRAAAQKRWHQTPAMADAPAMRVHEERPCEDDARIMRPHCGSICGDDAADLRMQSGSLCENDAADMPTTHHSPPTAHPVPEDANNAGAREADAAVDAAAQETADAQAAADDAVAADEAAAAPPPRTDAETAEPPPSLPRVLSWAAGIGCPPDKAEIWWNEHEARPLSLFGRWTDRDGNAVRRPQNALAAWWQKWQANDHQRGTRNHGPSTTSYHGGIRTAAVRSDTANAPGRYA